jgi:hypothetical protein
MPYRDPETYNAYMRNHRKKQGYVPINDYLLRPHSKLTELDVSLIKAMLEYSFSFLQLAKMFSVNAATIHNIKTTKAWVRVAPVSRTELVSILVSRCAECSVFYIAFISATCDRLKIILGIRTGVNNNRIFYDKHTKTLALCLAVARQISLDNRGT